MTADIVQELATVFNFPVAVVALLLLLYRINQSLNRANIAIERLTKTIEARETRIFQAKH